MLRYSSPAATTASGVRNGRGSIGSRMSITTAQPARFRAARCSGAGCPPVTTPGIGSQALGTPAMASSSWLIGRAAGSFPRTIYLMSPGMASSRRPSLRIHLKPHHKLWLNWDGAFLMGPRYLRFLDAVDRTGTIRAAGPVVAVPVFCTVLRLPAQAPQPFSTTPKLTGYLQPRFETLGDTASFLLRRARFAVEGNITPWASYRAQLETRTLGAAPNPV